jgi:ATP-dependent Clp protease ATP-binding subunit ClpA/ActR/RegA family two-component response regulator
MFSDELGSKIIGQDQAMKSIIPFVYMWQSGLAPDGRPAGIFLLLGPTGTGKTRTVEAIAEILHGDPKKILKIDCGEFQLEHEVSKLIGSPPGYLGHRETEPILNQQGIERVKSEECDLSLVLFDEVEKSAPSLSRMLLAILDKASLRLGDNSTVNFEKCLIFFTSNLGAREMMKEIRPDLGFTAGIAKDPAEIAGKLENVGVAAVKKRFSPEFVNRIDAVITYQPLSSEALSTILEHNIDDLQRHVNTRLGERCFRFEVSPEARQFLLKAGTSEEYGARELKRTVHRLMTQPLATMVASGQLLPGTNVRFDLNEDGEGLNITGADEVKPTVELTKDPTVLIVDDNEQLLQFLRVGFEQSGWELMTAETEKEAMAIFNEKRPTTVLLDFLLGDDDGLELGLRMHESAPATHIIIMTGGGLSEQEEATCKKHDFPVLNKPFLMSDILHMIGHRHGKAAAAA